MERARTGAIVLNPLIAVAIIAVFNPLNILSEPVNLVLLFCVGVLGFLATEQLGLDAKKTAGFVAVCVLLSLAITASIFRSLGVVGLGSFLFLSSIMLFLAPLSHLVREFLPQKRSA